MEQIVFEIRQLEDPTRESPGRLVGTLLRYNEVAQDRKEVFARGALTWPEAGNTTAQSLFFGRSPFRTGMRSRLTRRFPIRSLEETRLRTLGRVSLARCP